MGVARKSVISLSLFLIPVFALAAPGEWLVSGGDWHNMRHANGSGSITQPTPLWDINAPGSARTDGFLILDIDGNGRDEIITASAGKLQCRNLEGSLLWESAPAGINMIAGVDDFDGDGIMEVLALRSTIPGTLFIVSSLDGAIEFREHFAGTGSLAYSVVGKGDLNGDGLPDIVVKPSQPYYNMHAIGFNSGLDSYEELWSVDLVSYGYANYNHPVIVDIDGDGANEVAVQQHSVIRFFNGTDGSLKTTLTDLYTSYNFDFTQAISDGTDDGLITMGSNYDVALSLVDPSTGGLVWQRHYEPETDHLIALRDESLGDLNGDGTPEIVFNVFNNMDTELDGPTGTPGDYDGVNHPDGWSSLILDANTGTTLAYLTNAYFQGSLDIDGSDTKVLLFSDTTFGLRTLATYSTLRAYTFDGTNLQSTGWTLANAKVLRIFESRKAGQSTRIQRESGELAAFDADLVPGRELLVLRDTDGDSLGDALELHRLGDGQLLASRPSGEGTRILAKGISLAGGVAQALLIDETDSQANVIDDKLSTLATIAIPSGSRPFAIAQVDGAGPNELVVRQGGGQLEVYGLDGASAFQAPSPFWTFGGGSLREPAIFNIDGVGSNELLVMDNTNTTSPRLEVRRVDDSILGTYTFEAYGKEPAHIVPANLNGSGNTDILVVIDDQREPTDTRRRLIALDGSPIGNPAVFTPLWNIPLPGSQGRRLLAADLVGGDGIDDALVWSNGGLVIYNGVNGVAATGTHVTFSWREGLVAADFDADGVLEIAGDGYQGVGAWDPAANSEFFRIQGPYERAYAGEKLCVADVNGTGGIDLIVSNYWGELRGIRATDGNIHWLKYLDGGEAYDSPTGTLTELHRPIAGNIDGVDGDEVIVGSDDGYLYILDATNGNLKWSQSMGSAPRYLALADINANGTLELIAALDDGKIVAFDEESLAGTNVRELTLNVAGDAAAASGDVDFSEWTDRVGIEWDVVTDATAYRVSLESTQGTLVGGPVIIDGGSETFTILTTDPLTVYGEYRAVVQPIAAGALGPVSYSDGFQIVDLQAASVSNAALSPDILSTVGDETQITADLFDPTGLKACQVEITAADDSIVFTFDTLVSAQTYGLNLIWDGLDEGDMPLNRGTYAVTITAIDLLDRVSSQTLALDIAWSLLDPPVLSTPADQSLLATGTPTFTGSAGADLDIDIIADSTAVCTTTTDSTGAFACTPASAIVDGQYSVVAVASDSDGNVSEDSNAIDITIDTTPPNAPIIASPRSDVYLWPDQQRFDFEGYASEEGLLIEVHSSIGGSSTTLCTATTGMAPEYAWTCSSSVDFPLGDFEITATATDAVGNVSAQSSPLHVRFVEDGASATGSPEDKGCACNNSQGTPLTLVLGLLAMMTMARRRRQGAA